MRVYLFKPRFAALVKSGKKRQTIRPKRKIPTKVGDTLSLREWTGLPYRSKQRVLLQGQKCKSTASVGMFDRGGCVIQNGTFYHLSVQVDLKELTPEQLEEFAKADGFKNWKCMQRWFQAVHKMPFYGDLVTW